MISSNLNVRFSSLAPSLKSETILGLMGGESRIVVNFKLDGKPHDYLIYNKGMSLSGIFSNIFKTLIISRVSALDLGVLEFLFKLQFAIK